MTFRLLHEAEAKAEFHDAIAWYEEQAPGLGVRFIYAVDAVMLAIASDPGRFKKISAGIRQAQVIGWPYSIVFTINEEHREVKVIAIWHGARDPGDLKKRLS